MTVEAEAGRSFFTLQLARMLEGEGVKVPGYLLDLLDKPFSSFTPEDRAIYEGQIKAKGLLQLFARLLQSAYEASADSARHSWRGMYHLLKDSPIKVCAAFVLKEEEGGGGERGAYATLPGTSAGMTAPRMPAPGDGAPAVEISRKSYFTKKLERKLEGRGVKVPAAIISLLDKPFDDFTPQERELYEREFKGRQLIILFSELLDELYEETGKCESGWSAMCRFLKDTPIKLMATYVLKEEERLEGAEVASSEPPASAPPREKLFVRPYKPATEASRGEEARRRRLFR